MSHLPITPEERFATLVEEFLDKPEVTLPSDGKGFGALGLKFRQNIFAMLVAYRRRGSACEERTEEIRAGRAAH